MKQIQSYSFLNVMDAASPPVPSRYQEFRFVHDEIPMLQNVGRAVLAAVIEPVTGGPVAWPKFVTDSTSHRTITSVEEMENFFKAKTVQRRDLRRDGPQARPRRSKGREAKRQERQDAE